jgi:hypothetical protein
VQKIYPSKSEKETLLTQLNLLGAKQVYVYFQGGGDEGQIEDVYYIDRQDQRQDIPSDMIAWTEIVYGNKPLETKPMKLYEVLEDLCSRALDSTGLDWYNNEGGQGNLIIDFTESPPKTSLQVGINTMSTEDYGYDMDDEEEDE